MPTIEANNAVNEPNTINIVSVTKENSINGENLINKKTPAVTIVAACIKAETGVGPSIASGNQVCKPNCADLPNAPTNNNKPIAVIIFILY